MICECYCYARACLVSIEVNEVNGVLYYHFFKQARILAQECCGHLSFKLGSMLDAPLPTKFKCTRQ